MSLRTDTFDLGGLHLSTGEARRLAVSVAVEPFVLGGEHYPVAPSQIEIQLDVSRTNADGYALRLRFDATLTGPCMRCLEDAESTFSIDAREVWQPSGGEDLASPYVEHDVLDLHAWARDALALAIPAKVLCREDCAGLCAVCGENLNSAPPGHGHDSSPDPRWAKLSEIRFE